MDWIVMFETPPGHPMPSVTLVQEADYVLAFMASVIPAGWTIHEVGVNYENRPRGMS